MAIPLGVAIGAELYSGLGGSSSSSATSSSRSSTGLSDEIKALLLRELGQDRSSRFTPDAGAFRSNTQARIAEIMAQIAPGTEAFNADLASRGIFGAGEAPKNLYSSVIAPISRQAFSAATQGEAEIARLTQTGNIASEQLRSQILRLLGQQETLATSKSKSQSESGSGLLGLF